MSNAAVIEQINKEFVPVSVRAGDLNNPPNNQEGALLRSVKSSCLVPQGMFVLNSDGQVLTAVLMYDSASAISRFLGLSLEQQNLHPHAEANLVAQRFVRFPSQKAPDSMSASTADLAAGCSSGACKPPVLVMPPGALAVDMVGRSIDPDEKLCADTLHQEHYSQDQLLLPAETRQAVASSLASGGFEDKRLPEEFTRILLTHAYLGNIDVQPFLEARPGRTDAKAGEFFARPVPGQPHLFQLHGQSHVLDENVAGRSGLEATQAEHKLDEILRMVGVPVDVSEESDHQEMMDRRIEAKIQRLQQAAPGWFARGGDKQRLEQGLLQFQRAMPRSRATWKNKVVLAWNGFLKVHDGQLVSLWLLARGDQELKWLSDEPPCLSLDDELRRLPGGRPLDLKSKVIIGFSTGPGSDEIASHTRGR